MPRNPQHQSEQTNTPLPMWSWLLRVLSVNFLLNWLYTFFFSAPATTSHQSSSTDALTQLPHDLMRNIFSYLTPHDIQSALRLNKGFYKMPIQSIKTNQSNLLSAAE